MRYGTCISCDKRVENWEHEDAGHFIAASRGGFGLLFEPINVHLQHKKCNNPRFTPDAAVGYAINLDKRYGVGTAAALWDLRGKEVHEWSKDEYVLKLAGMGILQNTQKEAPPKRGSYRHREER